jgi:hypothetical protein
VIILFCMMGQTQIDYKIPVQHPAKFHLKTPTKKALKKGTVLQLILKIYVEKCKFRSTYGRTKICGISKNIPTQTHSTRT